MSLQDQLRELFLLDQQVRGLRRRLDAALRRQAAQQTKLDQYQQQHQELQDQVKHGEAKAASLEHQSNDVEQRITKLRNQMNTVTSNKEYSALLVEVNTLKNDKSKLEDQALEQMGEVEALKERLAEAAEKIAQQQKLVDQAAADVQEAQAEVGDRLDETSKQRDAAAQQVPSDVLATFERLSESHDGEALAEVEEQDRKRMEYICGGCYMSLPIERVNTVMTKPNELTTCTNCGRILYMDKGLSSAISSKE